ncbi:MAG: lipid-A-disaccharide synthase [Pseudomonadota bacterium]|nr:lipid-A-disaccharide synthase [Pseudomonadota bacterium]
MKKRPKIRIFLVAGEHSGDRLGGPLMAALKRRLKGRAVFSGVGGEVMEKQGLRSLFPMADVAVMGPVAVAARLPTILRRVYQTVRAATAFQPDAVVIIDSPEFTHPIAKRIRRKLPDVPVIDYVSPSVWAWRPGRARRMRVYVDHVLALLPFEPDAHRRLGGPDCTYIGHPLAESAQKIRTADPRPLARRIGIGRGRPVVVVLPGSRPNEVERLLPPFGEAIELLARGVKRPHVIIPAVASLRGRIEQLVSGWPEPPHLVDSDRDKYAAFRLADAALAASGTVTLELALAGTPMVVGYRMDPLAWQLRFLVKARSIVLANLVLDENVVPELLQQECTGPLLARHLSPLLRDSRERRRQVAGMREVARRLATGRRKPSEMAAEIVVSLAENGRQLT